MYDELEFSHCSHSKDPIIGCALEGVANVIAGIKDVSIIIHSPQGCASTVATAFDKHEIDFTRRKVGCTRLFETDIIMGASEKLASMIREADRTFNSKVMFIVGTCSADIIGEDIDGLCREMQPEIKARLIPVMAGGFRGDSFAGIDMGLEALLPLIPKQEIKLVNKVNLILPQSNLNPTWQADLLWVKEVLREMGVDVLSVLPHNMALEELEEAGLASANILLSHDAGYKFVRKLEERHQIPFILGDVPLPVGLSNTARWLRAAGGYFGAEEKAEEIITRGEKLVVDTLRKRALMIIPRYRNCRVALSADATLGIGMVRMLFEELEMIPELVLLHSGTQEARELLVNELNELGLTSGVAFSVDGYQLKQAISEAKTDVVIGSAWEKYMAEEAGIKTSFDLLSPTNRDVYMDRAYFGYEGMLNMLEVFGNDWERSYRSKAINWEQFA
ncbi:nitrogenase component 1 [Paenibacillus zanthoxyli]|uniref:nitrogenase component 1 n=1 Tax=Paenibacillus zanthoxyli TaxID=369399 RepID=UPI0004704844|nr:nitrogenase component 1 [Paenibacillus zanthoxyli]